MSADIDAIYNGELTTYEQRAKMRRERREKQRSASEQQSTSVNGVSSYQYSSPAAKRPLTPTTTHHLRNGSTSPIPTPRSTGPIPTSDSTSTAALKHDHVNGSKDDVFVTRSATNAQSSKITRTRVNSDSPVEVRKVQPLKTRSCTVSELGPGSPRSHSPLAVRLASLHLAGFIGRQQERERSFSPSPSPLTPSSSSSSKPSSKQLFFPDLDQTAVTKSSVSVAEKTTDVSVKQTTENTSSDSQAESLRSQTKEGSESVVESAVDSQAGEDTSSNNQSIENTVLDSIKPAEPLKSESATSQYTFVDTDNDAEKIISGEYNHLDAIEVSDKMQDAMEVFDSWDDPVMPAKNSLTSQSSFQTPPITASDPIVAKITAEEGISGRESRESNVSESKSFTFEDFGWSDPKPVRAAVPVPMPLDSPLPEERLEHNPTANPSSSTGGGQDLSKDKASRLKFIHTEPPHRAMEFTDASTLDRSSDTSSGQAVYRPIDVTNADDITVVPSSGFFDMSLSQQPPLPVEFDHFSPPPPVSPYSSAVGSAGVRVSSVGGEGGDSGKKVKSKKEGSPKLRKSSTSESKIIEAKSPSRFRKKVSSTSKLDEKKKTKIESSPKLKSKEESKKRGSLLGRSLSDTVGRKMKVKQSPQAHEAMQSHSETNLDSPNTKPVVSSPSSRKPPLPSNAKSKRNASSFRSDRTTTESSGKGSLPNLTSPTPSSLSEISTVDSSISDSEKSPKVSSFRKKISQSMRNLLRDRSPSAKTGWQFADSRDVSKYKPGGPVLLSYRMIDERNEKARSTPPSFPDSTHELHATSSETKLSSVTDSDRENFREDLEQIPRSYSLDRKKKNMTVSSDDFFLSSIEKSSDENSAVPTFSERLVDGPPQYSERSVDEPVNERSVDGPPSFEASSGVTLERSVDSPTSLEHKKTTALAQHSSLDGTIEGTASSDSDEYLTASDSELSLSNVGLGQFSSFSSSRESSMRQGSSVASSSSSAAVEASALSKEEAEDAVKSKLPARAGSSGSDKAVSAKLGPLKSSGSSKEKSAARKGILKPTSGIVSRIAVSSKKSPVTSPLLSRKSPMASHRRVIAVGSPLSSPVASSKATPTSSAKTTPISSTRTTPVKKTALSAHLSPTATKKTTPTSSRKTTPSHATKASPMATRKITPSKSSPVSPKKSVPGKTTPSPKSSPFSSRRISPSKLSPKAGEKLAKPVKLDVQPPVPATDAWSKSPQSASNFSRFSKGRVPIRKSPIASSSSHKRASTVLQPPSESLEERVARIRNQRKSEVIPRSPGVQEIESGPHSPVVSSSSSPQVGKRRKMGISNPTTPNIENKSSFRLSEAQAAVALDVVEKPSDERTAVLELLKSTGKELSLDVDSLLTSVGQKLDELDLLDVSTSETSLTTSSSSATNVAHEKKPPQLDLSNLLPENAVNSSLTSPPPVAMMLATAFSPTSSCHSQQSSFDFNEDGGSMPEIVISPTHERTPIPPRRNSGSGSHSLSHRSAFSPLHHPDRQGSAVSASKPASREKAKASTSESVSATRQKKSPIMSRRNVTASSGNLSGHGSMRGKKISAPALVPSQAPTSSISHVKPSDKKSFTSALPPRPPSGKKSSTEAAKSGTAADHSIATSSTGTRRPRNIMVASSSALLASSTRPASASNTTSSIRQSSATNLSSSSASKLSTEKPKTSTGKLSIGARSSTARSSARSSTRTKKTSAYTTPTHSSLSQDSHGLRPSSSKARSSMRSSISSTALRPKSAAVASRRGSNPSTPAGSSTLDSRKISTHSSPARRSLTRSSSGEFAKKIKPAATLTLGRDRKTSSQHSGGVYASMRVAKSSTTIRPQSASTTLSRNANQRSLRMSRNSVTRKSSHGTLPRVSTLARKATPPAIVVGSAEARLSLKRKSSSGRMEVFSAFDEISAQAEGSLLTSSDHRRMVRPKMRQKASTSHLKQLRQRKDITSEFAGEGSGSAEDGLDPNTYSTYMSKKNLDPMAIAGLAAKLDFTTVKLRKTGIVDQMLAEQAGKTVDNRSASPNPAAGVEYVTSHPVMLLKIKGRRHIQTRLVEPTASSLNSGDVFILVSGDKLFSWVGKSANVIEKARGSDIVMRILHKKELGCHASTAAVLKEEEQAKQDSRKDLNFWELLGGKRAVKAADSVPGDEVYERAVNASALVYELEGEGEKAQFVPSQHNTTQMVNVGLLNTKKILLFDFYSEVYLWIGKMTVSGKRRRAMELGKKHFESHCRPPVFTHQISPARASGRYRPRSATKSPRHSILNASGRRKSSRADMQPRPDWALFGRMSEGSESILFREKFSDWPEPGRIIKMKGHDTSMRRTRLAVEIAPADIEKLLKPTPPFEGLRLEGDNIHRGQGNYKVSKSSFSCNRVRVLSLTKWVVKEFENVLVPEEDRGIFYSGESYVIRWAFTITVVRELEGLTPGMGMFARDRKYQRSLQQKAAGETTPKEENEKNKRQTERNADSDSESEAEQESDEETQRVLESGGRDRCAYFFWQGDASSVSEKGASALMTIELDKEKGPQVRVVQSKEPAAFFNLFGGSMIQLQGRSETNSLQNTDRDCRMFCVRVQQRNEACLFEMTPRKPKAPLSYNLRSRGCFVIYDVKGRGLFLWVGSKSAVNLQKSARRAARLLKKRLCEVELYTVREGEEPNNLCSLIGDTRLYHSLANESRMYTYTPRLFELVSTTGEFVGHEVVYPARNNETEAFPFLQSDLYAAVQPAIFLLDAHYEVYVWLGWWPDEKNKLLREANATTGSAHSRWLRDKKLALQTAVNYCKGCGRMRTPRAYMVMAGMEHERFTNQFPFWEVNDLAQESNCKGGQTGRPAPQRVDAEDELDKYNRTRFSLAVLRHRPVPEGVDPAHLEMYLSDEEFQKVLKVDKAHFATMPGWKQTKLKKEAGLF